MGGKDAPAAPDYSQLAAASEKAAEISAGVAMENLDWAKEQYNLNRELLDDVLAIQMPIMVEQFENAQEDRARYEATFQPIEDDLIQEFMDYGSDERRTLERGRAMSDVAQAQDAQREQALQRLEGFGIDPSQTRSAALDANLRAQQAANMAAAGNAAGERVDAMGRALRAEAINIGKGMPSQVAQSYGQALAAGQTGMAGANQTFATGAGALNNTNWMNTAQSGYGNAANIMNTGYQNQMAQHNANAQADAGLMSGLGTAAGMMVGGPMGGALGGAIFGRGTSGQLLAEGGAVEGPGGPKDDAIPARLSDGEYVIPAEVVRRKGTEFFDKLTEKTQTEMAERKAAGDPKHSRMQKTPHGMMAYAHGGEAMRYAEGGAVPPPQQAVPQQAAPQQAAPQPAAPQPASYQGMNSWQQQMPTPQQRTRPVIPTAAQTRQPYQRSAAMQAVLDKYANRAAQSRQPAQAASASGRQPGESIMDYFGRKYGIRSSRQQKVGMSADEIMARKMYQRMSNNGQADGMSYEDFMPQHGVLPALPAGQGNVWWGVQRMKRGDIYEGGGD